MGTTGEFSFLDIVNSATRDRTAAVTKDFREIWLSPYEVKESDRNTHKEYRDIEALADSFLLTEQLYPSMLGKVDGEYRIIDGHRRNRANIYLIETGHERYKKVKYLYKEMTENMYELYLLTGNGYTQDLTQYEKTELAGRMKEVIERARDNGEIELTESVREIIGKFLGESSGQMGRMERINNGLIPEAKEQFKAGNMGISAAYHTARLPEEEQKKIAEATAAGEKIEAKSIENMVKERKELEKQRRKAEDAARRAEKAAKKAEQEHIGAAQASLQAERSAENADQSASIAFGMNPPEMSESDIEDKTYTQEEIKKEAISVLQELLTIPERITYEEVIKLQEILIDCSHRE